jgi:hypothetical protein
VGVFAEEGAFAEPNGAGRPIASEAYAAAPAISRLMAGNHGEEKARKTLMHTSGDVNVW